MSYYETNGYPDCPDNTENCNLGKWNPRFNVLGYGVGISKGLKAQSFNRSFVVFLISLEHAHKFSGAGAVPPRRMGAHRWP
jgi:hypothetical protein